MPDQHHDQELWVESMYAMRADAPMVKLILNGHECIMPPEKARQVAQWLCEAAEGAYVDAFLMRFMRQESADHHAGHVLVRAFREFRELSRRQGLEHEEADQL